MQRPRILTVRLSDSFREVWEAMADEFDAEFSVCTEGEPWPGPAGNAAVLVTAGGAEREALEWLDSHEWPAEIPLFVVGSDMGRRTGMQIAARGANDYFALPEDVELVRNALGCAVERATEALRRRESWEDESRTSVFSEIVGQSRAIREVLARAGRVLPHGDATLLIVGETGTGKELLARAIHAGGPRRNGPFVPVNCSALPDTLIESELFGHERGAFTDAHAAKPGLFEVADGGTLFLDEVGTLSVPVQAKLLRVLQDKEVRRVGGTKTRTVNVRVIAATNEDLRVALDKGTFRRDLYFRLGVIMLALPPLRDREDDAALIAERVISDLASRHALPKPQLGQDVRRSLLSYHWPGNVRELKNAVERALLLSPLGELDVREIVPPSDLEPIAAGPIPFPASLDSITAAAANATVEMCDGNQSEAARRLGISRRRLRRLLDGERLSA